MSVNDLFLNEYEKGTALGESIFKAASNLKYIKDDHVNELVLKYI